MRRFVFLGIAGVSVALVVLWFNRHADTPIIQSDLDRSSVTLREPPTEPPLEMPGGGEASESPAGPPQSGTSRSEPNIFTVMDGRAFPEVVSSPWSDGMERTILSYVSQHTFLALTDLEVQCEDGTGCVIFLGGSDVPVNRLNFGAFAQEQGFEFVVIRDRDGTDGWIVILRR